MSEETVTLCGRVQNPDARVRRPDAAAVAARNADVLAGLLARHRPAVAGRPLEAFAEDAVGTAMSDPESEPVSACDPHTHKARVLNAQCGTCIFRAGNLMHLSPGRLRQMTRDALQEGVQGIICHATLPYGEHPEFGPAICGGFFELHGHRNNFLRVMGRIGGIEMTDPPEEEL